MSDVASDQGEGQGDSAGDTQKVDVASSDKETEAIGSQGRSTTLVLILFFALLWGGVNWPWPYVSVGSIVPSIPSNNPIDFTSAPIQDATFGGWPFCYLVRYDETATVPEVTRFSMAALLGDLGIGAGLVFLVVGYLHRRNRRVLHKKVAKRRVTIADMLIVTLILAVPFAWWRFQQSGRKEYSKFAESIRRSGGSVSYSCMIPSWAKGFLPGQVLQSMRRARGVRIEDPSSKLVEQIVNHPHLQSICLGGGDYDLRLLDGLAHSPHLVEVRLAGRVLDTRCVQVLASLPRLETLNLMRTNVSSDALSLFPDQSPVKRLNLVHTDVRWQDVESLFCKDTLTELWTSQPPIGESDELLIDGWEKLQKLQVSELDTQPNSVAMRVTLANLPRLQSLKLDGFQKFDLTLRELPKLKKMERQQHFWKSRLSKNGSVPGSLWCEGVDIENLGSLEELNVHGLNLKQLRYRGVPQLNELGIGLFSTSQENSSYNTKEYASETAQKLIDDLGQCEGPELVDLDYVWLAGVDISPLTNNQGIKHLKLSRSGTKLEQWKTLEPMQGLEGLEVKKCGAPPEALGWILGAFPNLKHVAISSDDGNDDDGSFQVFSSRHRFGEAGLRISDHPNLESLDLGDQGMGLFFGAQIHNVPKLKMDVRFDWVDRLELTQSPSLNSLVIRSPLPPETKFDSFDSMGDIAVGGREVDDDFLKAVGTSKKLNVLTLAYPGVTSEGLKQLTNLGTLKRLCLPGADLTDEVIEGWPEMKELQVLDLSDTEVTAKGVAKLVNPQTLAALYLNGCDIQPDQLSFLKDCDHLLTLHLENVGIDAATLQGILKHGKLSSLNISDSEVDPKLLSVLQQHGQGLGRLAIRNGEFDDLEMARYTRGKRGLVCDLTGSSASVAVMSYLINAERWVEVPEWEQHDAMLRWRIQSRRSYGRGVSPASFKPRYHSLINVRPFAERAARIQNGAGGGPGSPASGSPASGIGSGLGGWLGRFWNSAPATTAPAPAEEIPLDEDSLDEDSVGDLAPEQPATEEFENTVVPPAKETE